MQFADEQRVCNLLSCAICFYCRVLYPVVIAPGVFSVKNFKVAVPVRCYFVQNAYQRILVRNAYQKLKSRVGSVAAANPGNWNT
jgi:hypothetical protein